MTKSREGVEEIQQSSLEPAPTIIEQEQDMNGTEEVRISFIVFIMFIMFIMFIHFIGKVSLMPPWARVAQVVQSCKPGFEDFSNL